MDGVAPDPRRTVCHGCRQVTHVRIDDAQGVTRHRPMVMPGEGAIWLDKAPSVLVRLPCSGCGSTEDPGWTPGFVPPA
jgi:hypothetical protein